MTALINFQQKAQEHREQNPFSSSTVIPAHIFERLGSSDRTDPRVNWTCPVCGPMKPLSIPQGYLRRECRCEREARYKAQLYQGKMETQRAEQEARQRKQQEEIQYTSCFAWLGEQYSDPGLEDKTFENFDDSTTMRSMIKTRMMNVADELPRSMIVSGPWGVGKTHLVCAILNHRRLHGKPSLYTTGSNLFNAIMGRRQEDRGYQDIIAKMWSTPLLVIDDPDHATATDFRINTYKEIFTKRCGRKLPTIIITNIAIKNNAMEMQEVFGGAAADRLNEGLVLVVMRGDSYRPSLIGK